MDARLRAADAILERGVRFRLPAPFYRRWLKKDFVTIRHLKAGTILEIARVVIASQIEEALATGVYGTLEKVVEPCARCIAIAVLNDERAIERKADSLTAHLLWKVSAASLTEIFEAIAVMNRVADFMNITVFLLGQTKMMTGRRNTGRVENGS